MNLHASSVVTVYFHPNCEINLRIFFMFVTSLRKKALLPFEDMQIEDIFLHYFFNAYLEMCMINVFPS